jgi:hypothetical protein
VTGEAWEARAPAGTHDARLRPGLRLATRRTAQESGTRTYTGTISGRGAVSGTWSDGGTGHSTGTWSLGSKANRACQRFWWWNPRHECFVRSH